MLITQHSGLVWKKQAFACTLLARRCATALSVAVVGRCGTARRGPAWFCEVQYSSVRLGAARRGSVWLGAARRDSARLGSPIPRLCLGCSCAPRRLVRRQWRDTLWSATRRGVLGGAALNVARNTYQSPSSCLTIVRDVRYVRLLATQVKDVMLLFNIGDLQSSFPVRLHYCAHIR